MIASLLDSDLYKFSMQYAVIKLYPEAYVEYAFINRGKTQFPDGFKQALELEILKLAEMPCLSTEDKNNLKETCPFLPDPYIDFLSCYHFDPDEVMIEQNGGDLAIRIVGPWYRTILWEVPLMAIVSELYFKMTGQEPLDKSGRLDILKKKADFLNELGVAHADFGSRRRYSFANHIEVATYFRDNCKKFVGTSNVHLAIALGIRAIGTQAHEFFMFHAAKYGYRIANSMSLGRWVDVYSGDLGIALTDTFTTDVFFDTFDMMYAKLFDGLRHDSGCPLNFTQKAISNYRKHGIDPMTKTIIFSDGLNVEEVKRIHEFCQGKIKYAFGIGTNYTNDVGVKPLNMVIKMISAKPAGSKIWIPTCKLSDVGGKHTGDPSAIQLCKQTLGV